MGTWWDNFGSRWMDTLAATCWRRWSLNWWCPQIWWCNLVLQLASEWWTCGLVITYLVSVTQNWYLSTTVLVNIFFTSIMCYSANLIQCSEIIATDGDLVGQLRIQMNGHPGCHMLEKVKSQLMMPPDLMV